MSNGQYKESEISSMDGDARTRALSTEGRVPAVAVATLLPHEFVFSVFFLF